MKEQAPDDAIMKLHAEKPESCGVGRKNYLHCFTKFADWLGSINYNESENVYNLVAEERT